MKKNSTDTYKLVVSENSKDEIFIKFADGEKRIQQYAIDQLGRDEIIENAEAFGRKTYSQFMSALHKTIESDHLNDFQNDIIRNHFSRF